MQSSTDAQPSGLNFSSDFSQGPQMSFDSLVNETFEMVEKTDAVIAEYDVSFLLENGKLLETNGDFALARNIYQALIRKGLSIPQSLAGMARTFEGEEKNDEAVRCYQDAIAFSSEYPFYQS